MSDVAVFRFESIAHPSVFADTVIDAMGLGLDLPNDVADVPIGKLQAEHVSGVIAGQRVSLVEPLLEAAANRLPDLAEAPARSLTSEAELGRTIILAADIPDPLLAAYGDSVRQLLNDEQELVTYGSSIGAHTSWRLSWPFRSRLYNETPDSPFSQDALLAQLNAEGAQIKVFADGSTEAVKGFAVAEKGLALNSSRKLKKRLAEVTFDNVTRISWQEGENRPTRILFPGAEEPEDFYLETTLNHAIAYRHRMGYQIDRSVLARARRQRDSKIDPPS